MEPLPPVCGSFFSLTVSVLPVSDHLRTGGAAAFIARTSHSGMAELCYLTETRSPMETECR
ncbi:hypothetical protein UA45_21830 [Morganella morganii]|uniref:Uncharacterized protein n=1 Tax=Morganella morganii TaxID=582 RepID=A0A0D8L2A8_MORMO|nr:hypothetical protein UA45_21830 [Morganella morganii]